MTACTEKEAAEKWCPHMRASFASDGTLGGGNQPGSGWNCIGSHCMQWRWTDDDQWIGGQTTRRGYCGLAGKP